MDHNAPLPAGKLPGSILSQLLTKFPVNDERVVLGPGIGRDTAAISFGDEMLLVKTDPITFASDRAAHHLVHVNANDIACQGGTPRWLVVTALLPEGSATPATAESLFAELNHAAAGIGVFVVGGHTEITAGLDRPILVGTMLGTTEATKLITPARAKAGDRILMTRSAGIEGTALIAHDFRSRLLGAVDSTDIDRASSFLEDPGISILPEAAALSNAGAVSAMHDPTEGGVATAIREIAEAAGCGATIARSAILVAPETSAICEALDLNPLGLLSSGSLLAIVPADQMDAAEEALEATGVPYSWIGKLTPSDAGVNMRVDDHYVDVPSFVVDEVARLMAGAT